MRDPTAFSVISIFCPRGRVRCPKVHTDLPPSWVWPRGLKALWAVSIPCSPRQSRVQCRTKEQQGPGFLGSGAWCGEGSPPTPHLPNSWVEAKSQPEGATTVLET